MRIFTIYASVILLALLVGCASPNKEKSYLLQSKFCQQGNSSTCDYLRDGVRILSVKKSYREGNAKPFLVKQTIFNNSLPIAEILWTEFGNKFDKEINLSIKGNLPDNLDLIISYEKRM